MGKVIEFKGKGTLAPLETRLKQLESEGQILKDLLIKDQAAKDRSASGGEPLLTGKEPFEASLSSLKAKIEALKVHQSKLHFLIKELEGFVND